MINKNEFKQMNIEEQVELVNMELKEAKGTKNFGKINLDFSYGFARSILTAQNYDTLEEVSIDGVKIKLFRKMSNNEIKSKEEKVVKREEDIVTKEISNLNHLVANDIYEKTKNINIETTMHSHSFTIFDNTYTEFQNLLNSDEFKVYEKRYVIELMFRLFLDKYKRPY